MFLHVCPQVQFSHCADAGEAIRPNISVAINNGK